MDGRCTEGTKSESLVEFGLKIVKDILFWMNMKYGVIVVVELDEF